MIYRFSQGQKSFSSNSTFAVSKRQTEFHLKEMDLSPQSIENQKLVGTKKYVMLMSCIPEPALQSCDIGQRIVFLDRCQLITTWSSNSKLETDSIFLGLPASKFAISHPLTSRGGRTYGRFCIVACEQAFQALWRWGGKRKDRELATTCPWNLNSTSLWLLRRLSFQISANQHEAKKSEKANKH